MKKSFLIGLMTLTFFPGIAWADSLILKTGEVLRGKIADRNEKTYYIVLDSTGAKIDVPVSKVSIADITSPIGKISNKGSVIVFAKAGEVLTPIPAVSEQTYRPVAAEPVKKKPLFKLPGADILEKAEKTVAEANRRTEESQKQMEALKAIADAANS